MSSSSSFQAALQKQQQTDSMDSSNLNSGNAVMATALGQLCSGLPPGGEDFPTVNGGQSDSYSESMEREHEPETAEEVSENGPLLGWSREKPVSLNWNYPEFETWFLCVSLHLHLW